MITYHLARQHGLCGEQRTTDYVSTTGNTPRHAPYELLAVVSRQQQSWRSHRAACRPVCPLVRVLYSTQGAAGPPPWVLVPPRPPRLGSFLIEFLSGEKCQ